MDSTGSLDVTAAILRNVIDPTALDEVPYLAAIDLITDLRTLCIEPEDLAQLGQADTVTYPRPCRHGVEHDVVPRLSFEWEDKGRLNP